MWDQLAFPASSVAIKWFKVSLWGSGHFKSLISLLWHNRCLWWMVQVFSFLPIPSPGCGSKSVTCTGHHLILIFC
jgi:hypothetical protein